MVDERDLAEEVAALERVHLLAVLDHVGRPLDEDEELAPGSALARQLLALSEVDLVRDAADLGQLLLRAVREQRRALQELHLRVLVQPHGGESKASKRV